MEYNMSINFKFIGFQLDPRLSKIIMIMIFIGSGRYVIYAHARVHIPT